MEVFIVQMEVGMDMAIGGGTKVAQTSTQLIEAEMTSCGQQFVDHAFIARHGKIGWRRVALDGIRIGGDHCVILRVDFLKLSVLRIAIFWDQHRTVRSVSLIGDIDGSRGRTRLLLLPERVLERSYPLIQTVDVRSGIWSSNRSTFAQSQPSV